MYQAKTIVPHVSYMNSKISAEASWPSFTTGVGGDTGRVNSNAWHELRYVCASRSYDTAPADGAARLLDRQGKRGGCLATIRLRPPTS